MASGGRASKDDIETYVAWRGFLRDRGATPYAVGARIMLRTRARLARSHALVIALAAGAISTAGVLHPKDASATEPGSESAEDRKAAAKLFADGQKAFNAGDYRHAGESFEEAWRRAPRLPPLYNAARAWHKALELPHAANLYAKYLKLAPPKAPDRDSATAAMREIEPKLAKVEIHAPSFEGVTVDGKPLEDIDEHGDAIVYLTPGTHVVLGKQNGKEAKQTRDVPAGSSSSMVLEIAPEPVAPPPVAPPPPVEPEHHGVSPAVVIGLGGGLTAIGLGLSIWSGLDTLDQRSAFDKAPTQDNLDAGRSKELRTNVFIGVTAGVAALTVAAAIFLVDWKGSKKEAPPVTAQVGFGPGSFSVQGTFR